MKHHAHGGHHEHQRDWSQIADRLSREGDVTMPLLEEALDAISAAIGHAGEVARVLDLGSGPGVAAAALAERFPGAQVVAVDGSEPLLALAVERARRRGVADRVHVRVADLEGSLVELGAERSVDVIWASMVMHHLATPERTLGEALRLLRPGGVMAISEINSIHGTLPSGFDAGRPGFVERLFRVTRAALEEHLPPGALARDWSALLSAGGFSVLQSRTVTMTLPAPLPDGARKLVFDEFKTTIERVGGGLDSDDRELLVALGDVDDPRCILRRDDLSHQISRTLILARRPAENPA